MSRETPTKENTEQYWWRMRVLLLHGTMLIAPLILIFARDRFHINKFSICFFKSFIGIDCPGCGITRSVMALFSGDISLAFRLHPAGPLIAALIALVVTYLALVTFTKFRGLEWRRELQLFIKIELFALVALLGGWIGKMFVN